MNVTLRIFDVFVTRFRIAHKNFLGDRTNSCTIIHSIFFKNGVFKNVKKNEKIRMDFEKSINSALLLCKINVLDIVIFFRFFLYREALKF